MKNINKNAVIGALSLILSLSFAVTALAVTAPDFGLAGSYAVLSSTYTNTTSGTVINGDLGFTTGPAVTPTGTRTNTGSSAPYSTAGTLQGSILSALSGNSCTFTFAPGAINLSTDTTHGAIGTYGPGVYCSTGAMTVGGPLTLNGNGIYIFRAVGALTSTAGALVSLNGASACDIYWTPSEATTLGANTNFAGNIIDPAGITLGANSNLNGRALAFGGTVTTDADTITAPSCSTVVVVVPPPVVPPPVIVATTTVVVSPTPTPVVTIVPTPVVTPQVVSLPQVAQTITPGLPATGFGPKSNSLSLIMGIIFGISFLSLGFILIKKNS